MRSLRLVLCALAPALWGGDARAAAPDAGEPPMSATMTCERVPAPGRVPCEVEARVGDGETISWGDVVLLQLPPLASALRGRIGPRDASVREPRLWRWPFAVVARSKGGGDVQGRVRLVVCRGGACAPRTADLTARLDVGD